MSKQLFEILFVFFTWVYFFGEGVTESLGINPKNSATKKLDDTYHIYRCIEQGGIIIATHLIFIYTKAYFMIPIFWLTAISGLGLYEMAMSWKSTGNPMHTKESKWFFIPHPPGWFCLVTFIIVGLVDFIVIL